MPADMTLTPCRFYRDVLDEEAQEAQMSCEQGSPSMISTAEHSHRHMQPATGTLLAMSSTHPEHSWRNDRLWCSITLIPGVGEFDTSAATEANIDAPDPVAASISPVDFTVPAPESPEMSLGGRSAAEHKTNSTPSVPSTQMQHDDKSKATDASLQMGSEEASKEEDKVGSNGNDRIVLMPKNCKSSEELSNPAETLAAIHTVRLITVTNIARTNRTPSHV